MFDSSRWKVTVAADFLRVDPYVGLVRPFLRDSVALTRETPGCATWPTLLAGAPLSRRLSCTQGDKY